MWSLTVLSLWPCFTENMSIDVNRTGHITIAEAGNSRFECWSPPGSRQTHSYDFLLFPTTQQLQIFKNHLSRVVKSHHAFFKLKKLCLNKLNFLFIWSESVTCRSLTTRWLWFAVILTHYLVNVKNQML